MNRSTLAPTTSLAPLGAIFLLAMTGCVSEPVVTVDHAEVRGVSLDGMNLDVYLHVKNENVYDVQIRRVHADVVLADQVKLAPVDLEPGTWIPSNDAITFAVPMKVPWAAVPAIATQAVSSDDVTWRFQGEADVTATRVFGIEENDYPIQQSGELPKSVFLEAAPSGFHVQLGGAS